MSANGDGVGPPRGVGRRARNAVVKHWRAALFVVGIGALGVVVRDLGPATIARELLAAGVFLPLMMVLEVGRMTMEVFVLRAVLGDGARKVPLAAYVRSAVVSYPFNILFPAGRASAEVARAAMLSPHLGAGPVALAAVQVQGASMLGITVISLVDAVAAASAPGPSRRLTVVILVSALMTGSLGAALLFGSRVPRLWTFLKRRIDRLPDLSKTAVDPSSRPVVASALSSIGRAIQTLFFTTAVFAAMRELSLGKGAVAQGISIAGSTFGDVVPQQVGVAEGAFLYFAATLDLSASPSTAVSLALLVRISQLALAGLALVVGLFWKADRPG